jgi:ABC-type arginine transport system ATPase subunit
MTDLSSTLLNIVTTLIGTAAGGAIAIAGQHQLWKLNEKSKEKDREREELARVYQPYSDWHHGTDIGKRSVRQLIQSRIHSRRRRQPNRPTRRRNLLVQLRRQLHRERHNLADPKHRCRVSAGPVFPLTPQRFKPLPHSPANSTAALF